MTTPDRPYHFVDKPEALAKVARLLDGAKELGVDAEMNGLHAFRANVCVLQIATEELDLVIDTVAMKDMSPIAEALSSGSRVVRYAHGAAHDVKCLKQDFGLGIGGLFDTYVAAQLLGVEKLGYGDIVQTRFGATLDKALQTADWGRRPLSPEAIAYLKNDIKYLIPLGRQLREELIAKDLLEEAEYEFTRVQALPADDDSLAVDAYMRPKETREMSPVALAVLRELFIARDRIARTLDRPPFKVAGEGVLVEIAKKRPASLGELQKIQGLPRHGHPKTLADFLGAVERGVAAGSPPVIERPPAEKISSEEIRARRGREDAMRTWRKKVATARSVPGMAVLPSYTLEELVSKPARSTEDLATRAGMIPKRVRLYGAEILKLQQKPVAPPPAPAALPSTSAGEGT